MFSVAQQRGRPCRVPTDYRRFGHTAAACHQRLTSTGTTGSLKRPGSKACLEFGVRFHWIGQEDKVTVMKEEGAFCYASLCGPRLTLCLGNDTRQRSKAAVYPHVCLCQQLLWRALLLIKPWNNLNRYYISDQNRLLSPSYFNCEWNSGCLAWYYLKWQNLMVWKPGIYMTKKLFYVHVGWYDSRTCRWPFSGLQF